MVKTTTDKGAQVRLVRPQRIITQQQFDELAKKMAYAAANVKMVTGMGNNAAILVMLSAHDKIKQHPRYRHAVKHAFKQALKAREDYERSLLHADDNRLFHVDDMLPESRKIYAANLTDAEYFEMWLALGDHIYQKTIPFLGSMWNKYRLSLIHHGIDHPDLLAWPMVAMSCLRLAKRMYDKAIESVITEYDLPPRLVRHTFKGFDISPVAQAWTKALLLLDDSRYQLEPTEAKNIEAGLLQICDIWSDPENYYEATRETVKNYEEVFRTKGEQKKALRSIAEARAEML